MTNEEFQKIVLQELGNIKEQVKENSSFISALTHQVEELNAKYDGLLNITASKEATTRIETKIDILSHRILAQDGEIQLLKQAK